MAERVDHGRAGSGTHEASAAQDPVASPSAALVQRLVVQGRGDPDQTAAVISAHPALKAEILAALQRSHGNAFVLSVMMRLGAQGASGPLSEEEIYAQRRAQSEDKWKNDPMLARALARHRGEQVEPPLAAPAATGSTQPAATPTTLPAAPEAAAAIASAPAAIPAAPTAGMPDERNVYEANRAAHDERWKSDPMYARAMARIRGPVAAAPAAEQPLAAPATTPEALAASEPEAVAALAPEAVAAPGAATAPPISSTREGLDSLNTPGAYDYRLQRVERLRQDILTGSETEISPDVTPETREQTREHIHQLSNEQLAAIQGYTSQDYKAINSAMRAPDADPAKAARLAGYIAAIHGGLDQLPSYEGEVYRGTSMSRAMWADWERAYAGGLPVSDAAFSSSSKSEAVAEDFLEQTRADDKVSVFCKIQSRSGKQVEFLSKTANELEVLFRGGAKFKIVYIADGTGPDGRPRKEVMLREVVDDERPGDGGRAGGMA